MYEKEYINQIGNILDSTDTDEEKVNQISTLELPKDCNPLLSLIHGDSLQLASDKNYAENNDPSHPSTEEIKILIQNVSGRIIAKIVEYFNDWSLGNTYSYELTLIATYGHFVDGTPNVKYEYKEKHLDIKSLNTALEERKKWDEELADRNKDGHKKISIRLRYDIYKSAHNIAVASGFISDTNNIVISTWLNQS